MACGAILYAFLATVTPQADAQEAAITVVSKMLEQVGLKVELQILDLGAYSGYCAHSCENTR